MIMWKQIAVGVALLTGVVSCASSGHMSENSPKAGQSANGLRIETLYQTAQCEDISRGGFFLVNDPYTLEALLLPHGERVASQAAGSVDFSRRQVLVVDFGPSPSGGVTSGLASDVIEMQNSAAVVRVKLPARVRADKRQTQDVSHSCTLYTIPAGYKQLQIRSQYDDLLTEF